MFCTVIFNTFVSDRCSLHSFISNATDPIIKPEGLSSNTAPITVKTFLTTMTYIPTVLKHKPILINHYKIVFFVVREARLKEIKSEILNSEKLKVNTAEVHEFFILTNAPPTLITILVLCR